MSKFLDQQGLQVLWELIGDKVDKVILRGYYLNGKFYTDSTYTKELDKLTHAIYIDSNTEIIYSYNGTKFVSTNDVLPKASSDLEGITKLYNQKGFNTDGTMTQKAITESLNTKFEVEVDEDDECAIFTITQ